MAEYEMPIEEQIKILVREFTAFKATVEGGFDAIDQRFKAIDQRFDAVDRRFDAIDQRFDAVDSRLEQVDERLDKIDMRLDAVHEMSKLGLEAVAGLRESTDAKFAAADKKHDEQIDLLKSLHVHLRKRVETVERRPRRRRS